MDERRSANSLSMYIDLVKEDTHLPDKDCNMRQILLLDVTYFSYINGLVPK